MFAYDICLIALTEHRSPKGNAEIMKYTQALLLSVGMFRVTYMSECFIVKEREKRRGRG